MNPAMVQAVYPRPAITEPVVQFQISPCGICGGPIGTGTGIPPSTSVLPVNFIPPMFHTIPVLALGKQESLLQGI